MRYIKESFKYIFINGKGAHFICLFFISLIPAALLAHAFPAENFVLNIFYPPEYQNWAEVWLSYFKVPSSFVALIVGFITCVIAMAGLCGALINHFRIGDLKLNKIFHSFNDYFFPAILYSLTILIVFATTFTLYTLLAYLWYIFESVIAYEVLSVISLFVLAILTIYITSSLTLWLPTMCIKGAYKNSFFQAFSQAQSKQKSFLPSKVIAALIIAVTAILSALVTKVWFVSWIITSIGYACAFAYVIISITITYFDENKIPRDCGHPYKWR